MRKLLLMLLLVLVVPARAAEVPEELRDALPHEAERVLEEADSLSGGLVALWDYTTGQIGGILRDRTRGVVSVLLVVVLCGAVEGVYRGMGTGKPLAFLPMAGALSVTAAAAGSLDQLIGLGCAAIDDLALFSRTLLPTLAAAVAAGGAVASASFHQVAAVWFSDLLIQLIHELLLPMVYLYIGTLTAAACLPENRLGAIAAALKKCVTWTLGTALLLFTLYLSIARVISGSADAAAVKMTKAAISGAVPVVGGIIAEVSETVLAGAGLLKNTVGLFGTLGILAVCVLPFLQLGIQYLLYKAAAFLAAAVGPPQLCRLIDGLGGAFGLMLGMTGSCALLLLVSVLSAVAAVVP